MMAIRKNINAKYFTVSRYKQGPIPSFCGISLIWKFSFTVCLFETMSKILPLCISVSSTFSSFSGSPGKKNVSNTNFEKHDPSLSNSLSLNAEKFWPSLCLLGWFVRMNSSSFDCDNFSFSSLWSTLMNLSISNWSCSFAGRSSIFGAERSSSSDSWVYGGFVSSCSILDFMMSTNSLNFNTFPFKSYSPGLRMFSVVVIFVLKL